MVRRPAGVSGRVPGRLAEGLGRVSGRLVEGSGGVPGRLVEGSGVPGRVPGVPVLAHPWTGS